jgi:hypothetical protein
MKGNELANGQHHPPRFELNLAVGQNGAKFFCSRGDAPGYVERGRWPLEERTQLQNSRECGWCHPPIMNCGIVVLCRAEFVARCSAFQLECRSVCNGRCARVDLLCRRLRTPWI